MKTTHGEGPQPPVAAALYSRHTQWNAARIPAIPALAAPIAPPIQIAKPMIIDPSDLDTHAVYKLLVGAVVPRPIAWVSSRNAAGILNLAPFSFFTVASREPPMLAISIGPRTNGEAYAKDTLTNLRETQEFAINMVSLTLANAMHETSINHPPEVDEFTSAGVTPAT